MTVRVELEMLYGKEGDIIRRAAAVFNEIHKKNVDYSYVKADKKFMETGSVQIKKYQRSIKCCNRVLGKVLNLIMVINIPFTEYSKSINFMDTKLNEDNLERRMQFTEEISQCQDILYNPRRSFC